MNAPAAPGMALRIYALAALLFAIGVALSAIGLSSHFALLSAPATIINYKLPPSLGFADTVRPVFFIYSIPADLIVDKEARVLEHIEYPNLRLTGTSAQLFTGSLFSHKVSTRGPCVVATRTSRLSYSSASRFSATDFEWAVKGERAGECAIYLKTESWLLGMSHVEGLVVPIREPFISSDKTAIIVSIIGVIGAIVAALIGLLGVTISAKAKSEAPQETPRIIRP